MKRTPRRGDDGLGYILVGLGPRTDAVWLAGNAIGLGLTLAAAFVFPGHGLIFAYLAVTVRLALYTQAAGWPGGEYFDQMLRLGLVAALQDLRRLCPGPPAGVGAARLPDARCRAARIPALHAVCVACVIVELGTSRCAVQPVRGRPGAPGPPRSSAGSRRRVHRLYEYFAFRAGWWKYEPARVMIGLSAPRIALGECLMFLVMLPP